MWGLCNRFYPFVVTIDYWSMALNYPWIPLVHDIELSLDTIGPWH